MWLSDLSIKRPVFITMVICAIVVIGGLAYGRMGLDLMPDISFPLVTVSTAYPGAGPEEVETLITRPLEEAVSSINGVDRIRSTSVEGLSTVIIEFKIETSASRAADDVRERVSASKGRLPKDALDPVVMRFDPGAVPVITFAVSDLRDIMSPAQLRELVDNTLKSRIERISGVAEVSVTGGLTREIQVDLRLNDLQARGLSVQRVMSAIGSENLSLPGGRLDGGKQEPLLRTTGEFKTVGEIGKVIVANVDGVPVRVGDIADVTDGFKEVRSFSRMDGKDSISITVQKQSKTNTVTVAEAVKDEIRRIKGDYPNVDAVIVADGSTFIRDTRDDVMVSLLLGGLFASLVVFFFFHDLRNTLVTVAGLPVIVIGAFAAMQLMGFSQNMLTLMALSLSIGMLIDDAIVVRENIFRHMQEGAHPIKAAMEGTAEIAQAVMATTFTIVAVFLPVAFTTGIIGLIFREFGLTVTAAVLISLFEAFTLAPLLSAYFFKPIQDSPRRKSGLAAFAGRTEALYAGLSEGYRRVEAFALSHRLLVIIVGAVALAGALALLPFVGRGFQPEIDEGILSVSVELPPGAALRETDRVARYVEDTLWQHVEVAHVFSRVGSDRGSGETASVRVQLKERGRTNEFLALLRSEFASYTGAKIMVQSTESVGGEGRSALMMAPIQINVRGDNVEDLDSASQQIVERMTSIPELFNIDRGLKAGKPELTVAVDRTKAADLGVSAAQIATTLRVLVNGETASKFRSGDKEYDIVVRLRKQDRENTEDILSLAVPSAKGGQVPLRSVTQARSTSGPVQIDRGQRERQVVIGASHTGALGDAVDKIRKSVADLSLPPGISLDYSGETRFMGEAFSSLGLAMALAVVFIYMVLASQFGSFVHPFTIMMALPLSIIGALVALFLTGKHLDVVSLIGLILLMGLVTKNSILLVDFTIRLRQEGMERDEALLTAGPIRLRPILMTTLAMILGMLPLALGIGAGGEFRAPMAIGVIGGLVTSTALTLLVVPVVYTLVDDVTHWRGGKRRLTREVVPVERMSTRD
ncbi:MAG: efflux RND transporter permease subunit [Chloroflexi bacterium]|nr:efflux RND transporter permease subunit [Chloroflexota bacterium]